MNRSEYNDVNILITGGAGFIGAATARVLAERGCHVRILDSLEPQIHGDSAKDSPTVKAAQAVAEVRLGDVRSRADLEGALDGATHVLHLAAETGTGQSMYAVDAYCDTNVMGTARLLEAVAARRGQIARVVVASSRAIYGEGKALCGAHGVVYPEARTAEAMVRGVFAPLCPHCGAVTSPVATDEASPAKPASVYAITKYTQERLVLATCEAIGVQATALRYQNVYGPGQSLINPYTGILSIFSAALLDGREINVFEDGQESRDFVYIADVVNATTLALCCDEPVPPVLNVGSGFRASVLEILALLGDALGVEPRYRVTGDFRLGDIRHNVADTSLVRESLGIGGASDLPTGIRAFAQWARDELAAGRRGARSYEESLREIRERGLLQTASRG